MSGYWAGLLTLLAINVVFAYGIYLAVAAGQLNLGGAGFQAVGAYAAAWLAFEMEMPLAVTIAASAVVTGVVGYLFAFPILRLKGVYLVLGTYAFAEVVAGVILNSDSLGGAMGMPVPTFIDWQVPVIAAAATALLCFYLMSTRFGLVVRAVHDDDLVADLMGVNVPRIRVIAFGIGAALAGLSGGLYAHAYSFVEIQNFNAALSIYVLLYVLLGGAQTPWGPFAGAAFFTLLPELLRAGLPALTEMLSALLGKTGVISTPDESWRFVILGVVTVLMMVFRPEGLITRAAIERLTHPRRRAKDTAVEVTE
ncbi:branched-chain amino acid ABC transporter permease [Alloyangia pacifica]|uniref:Amino acid/amide ABC transporter membrane protein 2, HAAT family n=1 Tax=Alloyangia pacifica TaxID=311180 RepID=A0A1I6QW53_9RHOB|nr:branched-chain amino acid ABC transporter permease [Alloyangia pacifica]SDG01934.1 amino acid/amide ABC transporter membrane protein 2, HAAT family [Alloyangia pacifica]SFS56701.1 amino acid/amide ABC transporter membrane protein 2, HAAT family [Alloyangia pacifica]